MATVSDGGFHGGHGCEGRARSGSPRHRRRRVAFARGTAIDHPAASIAARAQIGGGERERIPLDCAAMGAGRPAPAACVRGDAD